MQDLAMQEVATLMQTETLSLTSAIMAIRKIQDTSN
jgi:hypothetical protein